MRLASRQGKVACGEEPKREDEEHQSREEAEVCADRVDEVDEGEDRHGDVI